MPLMPLKPVSLCVSVASSVGHGIRPTCFALHPLASPDISLRYMLAMNESFHV